jgi:uroporphyrin-III C-methyltransferase
MRRWTSTGPRWRREETTLVVYMGAGNIAEIALQLMRHGMAPALPVLAVSSAPPPRARTRLLSTLGQIGTDVAKAQPEAPVLFVIGRVAGMYSEIAELDAALCEGAGMAAYA